LYADSGQIIKSAESNAKLLRIKGLQLKSPVENNGYNKLIIKGYWKILIAFLTKVNLFDYSPTAPAQDSTCNFKPEIIHRNQGSG